ncbi:MAG: hypothetical protein AAGA53_14770 [Pseudomonadota bacterium]
MFGLFGIVVFAGIFGGMLWANARRWRYLAEYYAEDKENPVEKRIMQSAVLVGRGGYNSLHGILTIGVNNSGLILRILSPFSLFHNPLFIPFDEVKGWGTTWYLNRESTELQFSRAPDVKVIMPLEQAEWIENYSKGEMALSELDPPQGKAGRGWYFFVLINLVCAVVAFAYLGWLHLSR